MENRTPPNSTVCATSLRSLALLGTCAISTNSKPTEACPNHPTPASPKARTSSGAALAERLTVLGILQKDLQTTLRGLAFPLARIQRIDDNLNKEPNW